jgi:hypothetical protein
LFFELLCFCVPPENPVRAGKPGGENGTCEVPVGILRVSMIPVLLRFIIYNPYFSVFKLKEQPPKIRMSLIWKREFFLATDASPFMAGGVPPSFV